MDNVDNKIKQLESHVLENDKKFFAIVSKLENEIQSLKKTILEQSEMITQLQSSCGCKRNELFYQRYLEKELRGSHKITTFGVTDITTDTHHFEIKHWRAFKSCLGQLQAYNFKDTKRLIAAFFGEYNCSKKESIIQMFWDYGIEVWELFDSGTNVKVIKHIENNSEENSFKIWLHDHLIYNQGSYANLKDILQAFLGTNLSSRQKTVYKQQIEQFVKCKFPKLNSQYRDTTYKSNKVRGWIDVSLSFYE
jgi:hypothetical protein